MPKIPKINRFWTVKAEKTDTGTAVGNLYLYGVISSETWWGDEVTPRAFREDLDALGDITELNVHIFSDGGDVFAGHSIYSILKQHPATVNAYIEGIAASIATIVMMAADHIYVSRNASLLIHNAMVGLFDYYNKLELDAMIKDLEKFGEPMIATYQSRTGMSRAEVVAMMDGPDKAGTWFTAQEAIDVGLADAFIPEESEALLDAVACVGPNAYLWNGYTFDLSAYPNAPKISNRRTSKMARSRKKPNAKSSRARRVRAELITVTCPECGAVFEYETDPIPEDPAEELLEGVEAHRHHHVTAENYPVTCPMCGAEFNFSTDDEPQPQEDGDEPNVDDITNDVGARRGRSGRTRAKGRRAVRAELIEVTCPECGAVFDLETDPADPTEIVEPEARRGRRARAEIYTVTCPECGATFEWDSDTNAPEDPADVNAEGSRSYKAGALAERRRIAALDTIAQADPSSASIVATAKRCGWSFEETSKAVFEDMAARGGNHIAARRGELNAKVGASPNSGTGNIAKSAQAKAVSGIVAGMTRDKKRR